jgi:hypothetical protein
MGERRAGVGENEGKEDGATDDRVKDGSCADEAEEDGRGF